MKHIIYDTFIAWMLLKFSKCHTIMLFGFVFSQLKKDEMTQATRNHEYVHARQWFEVTTLIGSILLLVVLSFGVSAWWLLLSGVAYYIWYVVEWMIKGINYTIMYDEWECKLESPYKSISFEREARLASEDDNYLENSGYFGWLKML